MGIDSKELHYLNFKKFKIENPKIFALPQEIQKMRWEHYNRTKTHFIEEIKNVKEAVKKAASQAAEAKPTLGDANDALQALKDKMDGKK